MSLVMKMLNVRTGYTPTLSYELATHAQTICVYSQKVLLDKTQMCIRRVEDH